MTITLGSLTLGDAVRVVPDFSANFANIDVPLGRNSSKQFLGGAASLELTGTLTGVARFENFLTLRKALNAGLSLKLDCDFIKTLVFVTKVTPTLISQTSIKYSLQLDESRFQQESACESTSLWSVDSGGGSLTAASSTPTPREGAKCLKLAGAIGGGTESRLKYTPSDALDFSFSKWIAFDFITDMLTDMTAATLVLKTDAGNYVTYDFHSLVTAAGEWLRIRVNKDDFSETGTMEWDNVTVVLIGLTRSSAKTYYIAVDDFGGYE